MLDIQCQITGEDKQKSGVSVFVILIGRPMLSNLHQPSKSFSFLIAGVRALAQGLATNAACKKLDMKVRKCNDYVVKKEVTKKPSWHQVI